MLQPELAFALAPPLGSLEPRSLPQRVTYLIELCPAQVHFLALDS